jgi:hypothetical protein
MEGMTSADLSPAQADRLRADLGRQLRYLNKLCARMQAQRWPLEDLVCRETLRARDAMQELVRAAASAGRKP